MNRENLKKSVIIIGPSGVGKSFVSSRLSDDDLKGYELINADMLYSFVMLNYKGALEDMDDFEKGIREIVRQTRLNPVAPYYSDRLSKQEKDADKYFATLRRYKKLFNFGHLHVFIDSLGYLNQFKGSYLFSDEGFEKMRSLLFIRMIDAALEQIDRPVILDAGSNFASDARATGEEELNFKQIMDVDYDTKNYMDEFMGKFGKVVYFDPKNSYRENPFSRQKFTKLHYKNGETYRKYATDEIDVSKFYNGYSERLFNFPRRVLDTDIDLVRLGYIDEQEVQKIVTELKNIIFPKAKRFE